MAAAGSLEERDRVRDEFFLLCKTVGERTEIQRSGEATPLAKIKVTTLTGLSSLATFLELTNPNLREGAIQLRFTERFNRMNLPGRLSWGGCEKLVELEISTNGLLTAC